MTNISYDTHDEFEEEITPSIGKLVRELSPFKKYTVEADFYTSAETMQQDLEKIQSAVIIDSVIQENNLLNKKSKQLLSTAEFLEKDITFECVKADNVLTVRYKNKDFELAKSVVRSIINNFVAQTNK